MAPFKDLYNAYFKRVYAYVLLRVKDAALAEDLCACAWRKAYEKLDGFDENKGVFAQWIFGIARNEINMHRRLFWVRRIFSLSESEEVLPLGEVGAQERLEQEELKRRLLMAAQKLPARERDIVSLKFYSGLNNRQISAVTGLSESNVGTLAHRAVEKLRRDMEDL